MRRRRAERCVLRAEEALAAGLETDAREALEEASQLNPGDTPNLEELRARLDARRAPITPPAAITVVNRRRTRWPAAVAMLAATVAVAGLGFYRYRVEPASDAPVAAAPAAVSASRAAVPSGTTAPAAPTAVISQETVLAVPDASREVTRPDPESPGGPVRVSMTPEPAAVPTAGVEALPSVPDAAASMVVPPAPPAAAAPAVLRAGAGIPLESLPSTTGAPASDIPATPAAAPAPAPSPAPEPAEVRIRAVLSAYETAFKSLDASAARGVWPSVDERALSRAFQGLASQSISLGGCDIAVEGDAATARCNGSATWAPRVGGGQRTAARRWDFALARSGNRWQIVTANVR